jgi:hypothetical protein
MQHPCEHDANTVQSHTGELPLAWPVAECIEVIIGGLLAPDHEILSGFTYRTARLRIPN